MEKVLVLGGRPIGSLELVAKLKELGYYVIVTDYLDSVHSPAKLIADEYWDISTGEIHVLTDIIKNDKNIKAIMTGVHEFNIKCMIELCKTTKLPCYCTSDTWKYCENKKKFKELCSKNNIPIAKYYNKSDVRLSNFPLIVKPCDSSGSRGFHICQNFEDLNKYYSIAEKFSPRNEVLIEEYIPYNSVIIHYTAINGKLYYSGMSDKISVKFENTGASVMGLQTFPSKGEQSFLEYFDERIRKMFEAAGFKDGPIWIEAFFDGKDSFIFNEIGYRFGGSLTYYPIKFFYGIDQLECLINSSLGLPYQDLGPIKRNVKKNYCILPVHIHEGKITKIAKDEILNSNPNIIAIVQVQYEGNEIKAWGSAQQVFAYVHFIYKDIDELKSNIKNFFNNIKVEDENGENMLFTLFDIDTVEL